jgi:uncharacterized integral membrane protein (TIGR00698 family)
MNGPVPAPSGLIAGAQDRFAGLLVAAIIALASQFVSEHYGAPAMLLALLFGIALNFLATDPRCGPGIEFGARHVLRAGVALLGLRISFDMVAGLGLPVVGLVVGAMAATIAFGLAVSRFFGFRYRFAFLSAGAVAICGASAAMAIAAILPKDERSEDRLVFTVVGVTVLSTVAMILYPVIGGVLAFDDRVAGIYLGATIHDVAQVVGAGFSISDAAGETATLVKLLRVAMLAPIVVLAALVIRRTVASDATDGARPAFVPGFVAVFVALAALNSVVDLPAAVTAAAGEISRWLLLVAIAAVGLKTVPGEVLKVGRAAAGLLVAETVFLAGFVAAGLWALGMIAPGGN